MKYINEIYEKDNNNLLFPTWTPCDKQGCVYFYFNTDKEGSSLMRAELQSDATVSITLIQEGRHMVRGCLVVTDDYLVQLGGVSSQFDYLNMGQQVKNIKMLKLNKACNGIILKSLL